MPIRIIPCLDIKDGRVVKGVQFAHLKDAGDPVEIAKAYDKAGADELVLLDIGASNRSRIILLDIIRKIKEQTTIPLTVGGGVNKFEDFEQLLDVGASKVTISSAAIKKPKLVWEAASKLGSEYITVAIDAKSTAEGNWSVYINGGRTDTQNDVIKWSTEVERLGAGEILLTSMDKDGTKDGYDLALLKTVRKHIDIPIIASGGAGKLEDFLAGVIEGRANAVLAASLFHQKELEVRQVKDYLKKNGVAILEG